MVQKTSSKSVTNIGDLPENCAQWKLMMFVDSDKADSVELKLDTSRIDKIKAMKLAWEAADPGRYERAVATREKYLESVGKTNFMPKTDYYFVLRSYNMNHILKIKYV